MEAFHDYTLASHQERFVAVLESALAAWNDTGLGVIVSKGVSRKQRERPSLVKVQVPLKHRLKWRREPYLLSLHLPTYVLVSLPGSAHVHDSDNTATTLEAQHTLQAQQAEELLQQQPSTPLSGRGPAASGHKPELSASLAQEWPAEAALDGTAVAADSRQHDMETQHTAAQWQSLEGVSSDIAQHESNAGAEVKEGTGSESIWQNTQAGAVDTAASGDADAAGWEVGVDLDMQDMMQRMEGILMQGAGQEDHDTEAGEDVSSESGSAAAHTYEDGLLPDSNTRSAAGVNEQAHAGMEKDTSLPSVAVSAFSQHEQHQVHVGSRPSSRRVSRSMEAPVAGFARSADTLGPVQRADTAAGLTPLLAAGGQLGGWWPFCKLYRPWWKYTHQHKLQHWFGLDHFVLLQPHSYSRRFLDEGEARTVLSSLACALTARGLAWPALVPVHDALRDAYWGQLLIPPQPGQVLDSRTCSQQPAGSSMGGVSVRLLTDSVHISGVADMIFTPQGQLQVLAGQLAGSAPHAAALCSHTAAQLSRAAGNTMSDEEAMDAAPCGRVLCSARYTYRLPETPPPLPLDTSQAGSELTSSFTERQHSWDAAAAWQPWAWYVDPVSCVELDVVWQDMCLACGAQGRHSPNCASLSAKQQAAAAPDLGMKSDDRAWWFLRHHQAHTWQVHVLQQGLSDETGSLLGIHIADRQRVYVTLAEEGTAPATNMQHVWPGLQQEEAVSPRSLHSLLSSLIATRALIAHETSLPAMGELAGDSWWWDRSRAPGSTASLPPPPAEVALSAALHDVFQEVEPQLQLESTDLHGKQDSAPAKHTPEQQPQSPSPLGLAYEGVAPPDSLLARLALHCMTMGSPRGVAVLWQRFTRALRLDYWEAGQRLPRMQHSSTCNTQLNLTCSLLHQKLQVLDACIGRLQNPNTALLAMDQQQQLDASSGEAAADDGQVEYEDALPQISGQNHLGAEQYYSASDDEDLLALQGNAQQGKGSKLRPQGMQHVVDPPMPLLNHPDRLMNTPQMQARPLLTADRSVERAAQLRGLMRLEGAAAAANTAITDEQLLCWELLASDMSAFKAANPGAVLQDFMTWQALPTTSNQCYSIRSGECGAPSGWQYMWDTAAPCPAIVQKKLQDAFLEGERILHDLDNLSAADVLDALMGIGITQAMHLLASSNAAQQLEPARQLCARFHSLSHSLISSSCGTASSLCHAQPASASAVPQVDGADSAAATAGVSSQVAPLSGRLLSGFQEHVLDYLLDQLHFLEQALVLGESLLLRMPGCPSLCSALLQNTLHGRPSLMLPTQQQQQQIATSMTVDASAASMQSSASVLKEYICSADVPATSGEQHVLAGMLTCATALDMQQESTQQCAQPADEEGGLHSAWPAPDHAEWVLTVWPEQLGTRHESTQQVHTLGSRMYVQHAGGQTRLAMTLVNE